MDLEVSPWDALIHSDQSAASILSLNDSILKILICLKVSAVLVNILCYICELLYIYIQHRNKDLAWICTFYINPEP